MAMVMAKLWDLGPPVCFLCDSGYLFGNGLDVVGFEKLGIADGLAVIGFPLSFDLLDGLNVDVDGSDVLGLAHGLVVDGLLLGLSDELGAVNFEAVKMIVCFLWDCKFLFVGFDVLWLADWLAITILLLGLVVGLNVVNFDLLVFADRLTATGLTLGLSDGFNVLGVNILGNTLALLVYII